MSFELRAFGNGVFRVRLRANVVRRQLRVIAPVQEIAEKFAFSESKVTSMLHRTRKKLLRYLKEEGLC